MRFNLLCVSKLLHFQQIFELWLTVKVLEQLVSEMWAIQGYIPLNDVPDLPFHYKNLLMQ